LFLTATSFLVNKDEYITTNSSFVSLIKYRRCNNVAVIYRERDIVY